MKTRPNTPPPYKYPARLGLGFLSFFTSYHALGHSALSLVPTILRLRLPRLHANCVFGPLAHPRPAVSPSLAQRVSHLDTHSPFQVLFFKTLRPAHRQGPPFIGTLTCVSLLSFVGYFTYFSL